MKTLFGIIVLFFVFNVPITAHGEPFHGAGRWAQDCARIWKDRLVGLGEGMIEGARSSYQTRVEADRRWNEVRAKIRSQETPAADTQEAIVPHLNTSLSELQPASRVAIREHLNRFLTDSGSGVLSLVSPLRQPETFSESRVVEQYDPSDRRISRRVVASPAELDRAFPLGALTNSPAMLYRASKRGVEVPSQFIFDVMKNGSFERLVLSKPADVGAVIRVNLPNGEIRFFKSEHELKAHSAIAPDTVAQYWKPDVKSGKWRQILPPTVRAQRFVEAKNGPGKTVEEVYFSANQAANLIPPGELQYYPAVILNEPKKGTPGSAAVVRDIWTKTGIKRKIETNPAIVSHVVRADFPDGTSRIYLDAHHFNAEFPNGTLRGREARLWTLLADGSGWKGSQRITDRVVTIDGGNEVLLRDSAAFGQDPKSHPKKMQQNLMASMAAAAFLGALFQAIPNTPPNGAGGEQSISTLLDDESVVEGPLSLTLTLPSITEPPVKSEPKVETDPQQGFEAKTEPLKEEDILSEENPTPPSDASRATTNPTIAAIAASQGFSTATTSHVPASTDEIRNDLLIANPQAKGASFFGISTENATDVVFAVDVSGSMEGIKLAALQNELPRAISNLPLDCQFNIAPFNGVCTPWQPHLVQATEVNKREGESFGRGLSAGGDTNFNDALSKSIANNPKAVFFLSDGLAPLDESTVQLALSKGITVHTIAFGDDADLELLKSLASRTGGQHVHLKTE